MEVCVLRNNMQLEALVRRGRGKIQMFVLHGVREFQPRSVLVFLALGAKSFEHIAVEGALRQSFLSLVEERHVQSITLKGGSIPPVLSTFINFLSRTF